MGRKTFDAEAAERDFLFDQGDDETFVITRENEDGSTKDITDYTFWLTLKAQKHDSDADAVVQKEVTNHTDPGNGETELTLTNGDTDTLDGSYYYDIQEKTDTGIINTLLKGTCYFDTDTTNAT
jgi:hypothetical protein